MRPFLLTAALLVVIQLPAVAQQRDTLMRADLSSARNKAMLYSTLGSAAGILGGGVGGVAICKATGWGNSGEDPCLGHMLLGGLIGSIVGAAAGAYLPTRKYGVTFPLGPALGGTVLGLGAGYLAGQLTDGPGGYLVAFSVTQGVVTGLLTTRSSSR